MPYASSDWLWCTRHLHPESVVVCEVAGVVSGGGDGAGGGSGGGAGEGAAVAPGGPGRAGQPAPACPREVPPAL